MSSLSCSEAWRDLMPLEKTPNRPVAEAEAMALPDLLAQLHDRRVRLFLELRKDEIGMSLDALRSVVAAHLQRPHVPGNLDPFAQRIAVARPISNRAAA